MSFLGFTSTKCHDLPTLHQDKDDSYFDRLNEEYKSQRYNMNMDAYSVEAIKQEPLSPSSSQEPRSDISKDYTDEQTVTRHDVIELPAQTFSCDTIVKQELYTPPAQKHIGLSHMRKSMSTTDLHTFEHSLQQLDLNVMEIKRYRSSSARKNEQPNAQTRFIAMAEQIYHLHRDTPKRFHTMFKQDQKMLEMAANRKKAHDVHPTVPQSPALICKNRIRPTKVISQKEIEEREIEEMKKYKIKANPIPRAVTSSAPIVIGKDVQRKTPTVIMPFNLTEVKKKEPQSEEEKFVFTAKPVPKNILVKRQVPMKPPVHLTQPISPKLHKAKARSEECLYKQLDLNDHMTDKKALGYKYDRVSRAKFAEVEIGHTQVPLAMKKPVKPLKPVPFSFEKRDEVTKHKKEEKIKKVFEEEKKMRQFKANPIPSVIKKKLMSSRNSSHNEIEVDKENKSDNIPIKFEAKPPTVLKKEPFVPVLDSLHIIEPRPFNLASERRACERKNFNKHLKEKEEECARMRAQAEEERRAAEEREVARLRTQLVHQAQPVRHYAPLKLKPSQLPLTVPASPSFSNNSTNKH